MSGTSFFFFNDTATTEIYTLSLHDALPIFAPPGRGWLFPLFPPFLGGTGRKFLRSPVRGWTHVPSASSGNASADRKSTRLNSSHANISYAVFCLKKKKTYMRKNLLTLGGIQ